MSDIVPNVIDPLLPDAFFAAMLQHEPIASLINGRFAPAKEGFEPIEFLTPGTDESEGWPFVLFGLDPNGRERLDQYAQTPTLLESPFLIRAFMREDVAKERQQSIDVAPRLIQKALQEVFSAVEPLEVLDDDGNLLGTVHGCEILAFHRQTTGKRGTRISEMGISVLIVCN